MNWKSVPGFFRPESNDVSSAVTECSSWPRLCQATVDPAGTVSWAGSKCQLVRSGSLSTIWTMGPAAGAAGASARLTITAASAAITNHRPLPTVQLSPGIGADWEDPETLTTPFIHGWGVQW